jgi:drug/metabolite transporter (DMT)-like permease
MTLQIGILLALLCAVASNLGNFLKHRGVADAAVVDIRKPIRTAIDLWKRPAFAIGMGVGCVAWGFHVAAMSLAPLSIVQVVLAAGVVLIAVMADRIFGMKVRKRQWAGLGLTTVGLGLIAITMPSETQVNSAFHIAPMACFEAGLLCLGALLILGPRAGAPARHHGVMLAAAAGVLFGVCDVAIKALTGVVGIDGITGIFSPWLAVAALASFGSFYAAARALQDGGAVEVIAITGTAANISVVAGGILVFDDPLPGTVLGIVLQGFAFLMIIVASAMTPAPGTGGKHAPSLAGAAA